MFARSIFDARANKEEGFELSFEPCAEDLDGSASVLVGFMESPVAAVVETAHDDQTMDASCGAAQLLREPSLASA